ncbi:MAG TPA: ATP-binding protein, partial [Isosphaeraceae bacterium]
MADEPADLEGRILILAPTARDATACLGLLSSSGVPAQVCGDLAEVCREIDRGAGAAVVTQEAVLSDKAGCLAEVLAAQPPWSDFPLIVLTAAGGDSPAAQAALLAVGHMTLMKRPVQVAALVSTARAALRDRRRQYQARDHFVERERQARALAEGESRFRTLAESIPQLAWMARPDGHLFWYNRRWYEYTGATPEQMEGWGWQSVHDPEALPGVVERWKASLASGDPFDMVFPLRGADGRFRPFLTRVVPSRDDDGRIVVWFGTNTDIAERVEMEQALKQADQRKDEFLAMLAHELRNPLAAISNAVQLAKRSDSPDQIAWGRHVVEKHVRHLTRMIDDLLDVSRITRGKVELRKQPVALLPILRSALETARPLVEQRRHALDADLDVGPARVEGDPTRLEQVFINLLNNAAKYTDPGGRIAVRARVEGEDVEVAIEDTGIGMSPDLLAHAFDLFAQGDRSIARTEGGLGIGLTLVRSLVELHGGTVEAVSAGAGRGSRFTVRLPALRRQLDQPDELPAAAEARRKVSRVLIVDDSLEAASGLARLLALLGHEISVAHDGPSALDAARAHRPEVILLDIGLPGMDGYEV